MDKEPKIEIKTDDRMIIHTFMLDENGQVIVHGEKVEDIIREKEYWRREALTYADHLGMLRYYFAKQGITMEKVLEDCKTMFPE